MAETLLNQIVNEETDLHTFLQWLSQPPVEDSKFAQLSTDCEYKFSRTDFVTYFLNFVHEEIGSSISEKKSEIEDSTKSSGEINRSQSFPLDLSSEADDSLANSTPKVVRVSSDSVLGYMSPISPIYKAQNSFTTPKAPKSSLCLGDFIVNKKVSSRKKGSETKRRIKPTNLSQNRVSSFHKSENSFNFNGGDTDELPIERNFLVEEKLRILSRSTIHSVAGSPKKEKAPLFSGEIKPELDSVSYKDKLGKVVEIYTNIVDCSYVLNLTSEVYFLISLLLKQQFYTADWGVEALTEKVTTIGLFKTVHNVVFFAAQCLEKQLKVLRNFDNSTIRLLLDNDRLKRFAPQLVKELQNVCKPDRIVEIAPAQSNICFNSDTDNRQNFPNDLCFHAFRKQRDLFYEILRLWELHHPSPGFDYVISLGGKIKSLFGLSSEATNLIHFARLFKSQLLSTCRNGDSADFLTSLDVDAQKLRKLKSRCVTKGHTEGLNSLPQFTESEDFYKEFLLVAANYSFNRHFCDAVIQEITELNDHNVLEEDFAGDVTKKSYYTSLKSLRTLAKFLGFVESLPYKTDCVYSDHLLGSHLQIRQHVRPNFDLNAILDTSIRRKSLILSIPWVIKYISMLDHVTLRLPYFTQIHTTLFWIYRNFTWGPETNVYLVKFCLGWLFELPHLPERNYLKYCWEKSEGAAPESEFCLDGLEVVDQDILYFCCPYLNEIKRALSATTATQSVSVKHITPVTALQAPEDVARKKLELQLEEAFFNGQPISLRKTVEFVSERIASACVKHICHTLVPRHKRLASEKFKSSIHLDHEDDVEAQKAIMRTKANHLAATCLDELRKVCNEEITTVFDSKIRNALEALLAQDVLPQTKEVCIGVTRQMCRGRVTQWIDSHVILSVFTKDFHDEIEKLGKWGGKKQRRPLFVLPPGGTNGDHNPDTTSPAHLLENYRALTIQVIEGRAVPQEAVMTLIDDTAKSINERGDFNQCIVATISTQLLDLVLLLLAHDWTTMSPSLLLKCCDIWRFYYDGCDSLFKLLLCPRNVQIFAKSKDKGATWNAFAKFCAYLLKSALLSREVFESQCTGIFTTEWDQDTLRLITDFFRTFGGLYRAQGGSSSDFTFLLDFFSDYCEDLY